MDNWQRFARWYDLDQGTYEEDLPFYLSLARRTGSPILELGCGTGRLVSALVHAGHQVVGVDNAAAMLAWAQEKLAAAGPEVVSRARFVRADLRQLALAERFPLAILAVNTLMHLETPSEQALALAQTFQHLLPGGVLALDLFHPQPAALTPSEGELVLEKKLIDPETGALVLKFIARQADFSRQIITTTFIYDQVDAHGQVTRTAMSFPMRYLHRPEVEQMLLSAGFIIEGVYGTYDLEPYEDMGERMLFLAHRPEP